MKQSGIEQRKKISHIDTIFAYTLLLVFGTCTLLLIALSASVYQKNTKRMNQNDEKRTISAYLTEKLQATDEQGCIRSGSIDKREALLLLQTNQGTGYTTYLYTKDGFLMELFARTGEKMSADAGKKILELKELQIREIREGYVNLCVWTRDGEEISLIISRHAR